MTYRADASCPAQGGSRGRKTGQARVVITRRPFELAPELAPELANADATDEGSRDREGADPVPVDPAEAASQE